MQLDALPAAKIVDDRMEGHVQGAVNVGQIVDPIAAAEGHRSERHAVLREHHGQMMPAAAHRFGRAAERDAGGAEQRA